MIRDFEIFLPMEEWFYNDLQNAMKTCFNAILLIITHTVGRVCDGS